MICWVLGSAGLLAAVCACVLATRKHASRARAVTADTPGVHGRAPSRARPGPSEQRRGARAALASIPVHGPGGVPVTSLVQARLAGEWNVRLQNGKVVVVSGRRIDDIFVVAERVRQGSLVTAFAVEGRHPGLLLLAPDASAWLNVEDVRDAGRANDDQALMRNDFR